MVNYLVCGLFYAMGDIIVGLGPNLQRLNHKEALSFITLHSRLFKLCQKLTFVLAQPEVRRS